MKITARTVPYSPANQLMFSSWRCVERSGVYILRVGESSSNEKLDSVSLLPFYFRPGTVEGFVLFDYVLRPFFSRSRFE